MSQANRRERRDSHRPDRSREDPVSTWMSDTLRVPDTVTVAGIGGFTGPLAEQVGYPPARRLPAPSDAVLRLPDGSLDAGQDLAIAPGRGLRPCHEDVARHRPGQDEP